MPLLKPTRGTLLNTSHPLARGLVGCWSMNEGTGKKIFDSSGHRNTGTFVNTPIWIQGDNKSAIDFEAGDDDYIDCGPAFQITNQLTVIAKIRLESIAAQYPTVASKWESVGVNDRQWKLVASLNGSNPYFDISSTGANDIYRQGTAPLTLGEWITIAGVFDGINLTLDFYKNGILDNGALTGVIPNSLFAATSNVLIGNASTGVITHRPFDGKIEYICVWNRVLSSVDIAQLHREPFCMFERAIRPGLIGGPIVNLVGTLTALSSLSATAKAIRKADGTVASKSNVAALLNSIRGEESSLEIERSWLREALFNGMAANAFKLGTTLSLGWFWVRVAGCSVLYRGPSMERIDFTNILTVAEQNACEISPPSYIPHNSSSTYFYVIRRFSNCGYQELTLTAAAKVSIDANGELEKPQPSNIFSSKAEQVNGNKIQLVWFYCPLEQKSQPVCFNVYYDGGMGQIDYENPLAKISYERRRFYSYQSGALGAGGYLFTIRAEDADGVENSSSAQLKIQLDTTNPDAIDILSTETV